MRKIGYKVRTMLAIGVVMSLCVGCGASSGNKSVSEYAPMEEAVAEEEMLYDTMAPMDAPMENGSTAVTGETKPVVNNRKLIKNVSMDVETEQFDTFVPSIEKQVADLGGYIESLNTRNGSYYDYEGSTRSAEIVARIPKNNLDAFVSLIEGNSNITNRTENVEDVTLQYVDLESHKKMLLAEQESLLSLLENAESIEDIITIEGRLSEVRYQIESMESQLRTFDNLVDYSTVRLYINEVKRYTPVEEIGTWEKIATGFWNNVVDIGEGFKNFGIGFVIRIPYFVVWAVILFIVWLIVKGLRKMFRKNKEKKQKGQKAVVPTVVEQNQTEQTKEADLEGKDKNE